MLRGLATLPLVYIIATEFILGYRSSLHTTAILHLQPPFLAVMLARNVREAAVYLGAHAMLIVNVPLADVRIGISALLMNDLILLAAAWVKGELAWIAAALCANYDTLADYVADLNKSDKEDAKDSIARLMPRTDAFQGRKLRAAYFDTFERV